MAKPLIYSTPSMTTGDVIAWFSLGCGAGVLINAAAMVYEMARRALNLGISD